MKLFLKNTAFIIILVCKPVTALSQTEIGLQFYVDNSLVTTTQADFDAEMSGWVEQLNDYFLESNISLEANLLKVIYRNISNGAEQPNATQILDDMEANTGDFTDLSANADAYGADFSFAIMDGELVNSNNDIVCGLANRNSTIPLISDPGLAVAVVQHQACSIETLAHEMGHLMGLDHGLHIAGCLDDMNAHLNGITTYAYGFAIGDCNGVGDTDEFFTLMVGNWFFVIDGANMVEGNEIPEARVHLFSNPSVMDERCGSDDTCGDATDANAALVLNDNKQIYADHQATDVDKITYEDDKLSQCMSDFYSGVEITDFEVLDCSNKGIRSIAGIESLINLTTIDLSNNPISNYDALVNFPGSGIQQINITGNIQSNCTDLDSLESQYGENLMRPEGCPAATILLLLLSNEE